MELYRLYNETGIDLLNFNETDTLEIQFSDSMKLVIILLISLIIVFTVLGNILVMLAFIVDKRLHTQSNFFLLNLAICDFIIGVFVSPLYVHYLLTGKWVFGRYLCKLWLICDYTMCTASAFNIVLISYDRFLSVTKAVLYRSFQKNHTQTVLRMAAVWVMSSLLYSPAILFWKSVFSTTDVADSSCSADFYETWYFNLITSCFDFILPLISISYFNLTIYWNISKRSRRKTLYSIPLASEAKKKHVMPFIISTNLVLYSMQQNREKNTAFPI
ncbi:PREDICTED: histamine H3 receptor-like [Nanorana parkeri]|uniref:histamine H3 receptor-like n=1 Tax=Nanorana parkeri TaxID=125878 RepID=UPI0008544E46|nr:PREDICTED: histamine H3 receptor-like [Nanorana parkeri]